MEIGTIGRFAEIAHQTSRDFLKRNDLFTGALPGHFFNHNLRLAPVKNNGFLVWANNAARPSRKRNSPSKKPARLLVMPEPSNEQRTTSSTRPTPSESPPRPACLPPRLLNTCWSGYSRFPPFSQIPCFSKTGVNTHLHDMACHTSVCSRLF